MTRWALKEQTQLCYWTIKVFGTFQRNVPSHMRALFWIIDLRRLILIVYASQWEETLSNTQVSSPPTLQTLSPPRSCGTVCLVRLMQSTWLLTLKTLLGHTVGQILIYEDPHGYHSPTCCRPMWFDHKGQEWIRILWDQEGHLWPPISRHHCQQTTQEAAIQMLIIWSTQHSGLQDCGDTYGAPSSSHWL